MTAHVSGQLPVLCLKKEFQVPNRLLLLMLIRQPLQRSSVPRTQKSAEAQPLRRRSNAEVQVEEPSSLYRPNAPAEEAVAVPAEQAIAAVAQPPKDGLPIWTKHDLGFALQQLRSIREGVVRRTLRKLHLRWYHAGSKKMQVLLEAAGVHPQILAMIPSTIHTCDICRHWQRPGPTSVASTRLAETFNKEVRMDPLFYKTALMGFTKVNWWTRCPRRGEMDGGVAEKVSCAWNQNYRNPSWNGKCWIDAKTPPGVDGLHEDELVDEMPAEGEKWARGVAEKAPPGVDWLHEDELVDEMPAKGEKWTGDQKGGLIIDLVGDWMDRHGIQVSFRARGQRCGLVERHNEILRRQLHLLEDQSNAGGLAVPFSTVLSEAVFAKNAMFQLGNATPYEAIFGRHPPLMATVSEESGEGVSDRDAYTIRRLAISSMIQATADSKARIADASKTCRSGELLELKLGDLVKFYRKPMNKDTVGWHGPDEVVNLTSLQCQVAGSHFGSVVGFRCGVNVHNLPAVAFNDALLLWWNLQEPGMSEWYQCFLPGNQVLNAPRITNDPDAAIVQFLMVDMTEVMSLRHVAPDIPHLGGSHEPGMPDVNDKTDEVLRSRGPKPLQNGPQPSANFKNQNMEKDESEPTSNDAANPMFADVDDSSYSFEFQNATSDIAFLRTFNDAMPACSGHVVCGEFSSHVSAEELTEPPELLLPDSMLQFQELHEEGGELREVQISLPSGLLFNISLTMCEVLEGTCSAEILAERYEDGKLTLESDLVIDAAAVYDHISHDEARIPHDSTMTIHGLKLRELLQTGKLQRVIWCDTRCMQADGLNKGTVEREPLQTAVRDGLWKIGHAVRISPSQMPDAKHNQGQPELRGVRQCDYSQLRSNIKTFCMPIGCSSFCIFRSDGPAAAEGQLSCMDTAALQKLCGAAGIPVKQHGDGDLKADKDLAGSSSSAAPQRSAEQILQELRVEGVIFEARNWLEEELEAKTNGELQALCREKKFGVLQVASKAEHVRALSEAWRNSSAHWQQFCVYAVKIGCGRS
eukprot:s366_g30.t1